MFIIHPIMGILTSWLYKSLPMNWWPSPKTGSSTVIHSDQSRSAEAQIKTIWETPHLSFNRMYIIWIPKKNREVNSHENSDDSWWLMNHFSILLGVAIPPELRSAPFIGSSDLATRPRPGTAPALQKLLRLLTLRSSSWRFTWELGYSNP